MRLIPLILGVIATAVVLPVWGVAGLVMFLGASTLGFVAGYRACEGGS